MTKPLILIAPWALEAIQREAEARAMRLLYNDEKPYGLSMGNILLLKRFYEQSTGKAAHKIKQTDLKKRKRSGDGK